MESFIAPPWVQTIAIVVFGLFSLFSIIDRFFNQKKKDTDAADDRLIKILQNTVIELDGKVKLMEEQQKKNKDELLKLRTDNDFMKEIFQGRNKDTIDFQQKGLVAIAQVAQMAPIIVSNNEAILEINKNIEKLYEVIEKLVEKK